MWEKAFYADLVVGEEDKRMKNWSSSHLNFHLSTQTIGLKLVNHVSVITCPGFGSVPGECHVPHGGVQGWWALQKCNYVFEELIIVSILWYPEGTRQVSREFFI